MNRHGDFVRLGRFNPGSHILLIEAISLHLEPQGSLQDKTVSYALKRMQAYIDQGIDPLTKDEHGKTCADYLREIDHPGVREFVWQCDKLLIERSLEQDYRPSWLKPRVVRQDSTNALLPRRRRAM